MAAIMMVLASAAALALRQNFDWPIFASLVELLDFLLILLHCTSMLPWW
jgi:hypothetical protein